MGHNRDATFRLANIRLWISRQGTVTLDEAKAGFGESAKTTMLWLAKKGEVERVSRGVYKVVKEPPPVQDIQNAVKPTQTHM